MKTTQNTAAERSRIVAPPHLTLRAKQEWARLAPVARRIGSLTTRSARSFELLCETLATERAAREMVAQAGITVETGRGGAKPHPALRTMETARAQATALLKLFRLEPPDPKKTAGGPRTTKGNSPWRGLLKD